MKLEPVRKKINKPWGHEIILSSDNSPVTSKILYIKKGHRFSLQHHETKEEILTLLSGKAYIYLGKDKESVARTEMEKDKGYLIRKSIIHRCEAIEDCEIYESSTPEKGTTVRLEDDYSRGDETEEARKEREGDKVYMG